MPRRRRASKAKGGALELELVLGMSGDCKHLKPAGGPCPDPYVCLSAYPDAETREAAYWEHRDVLLAARQGTRPAAWWEYEAACRHDPQCPRPDRAERLEWLAFHGEFDARERAHLLRFGSDVVVAALRRGEKRRKREH